MSKTFFGSMPMQTDVESADSRIIHTYKVGFENIGCIYTCIYLLLKSIFVVLLLKYNFIM